MISVFFAPFGPIQADFLQRVHGALRGVPIQLDGEAFAGCIRAEKGPRGNNGGEKRDGVLLHQGVIGCDAAGAGGDRDDIIFFRHDFCAAVVHADAHLGQTIIDQHGADDREDFMEKRRRHIIQIVNIFVERSDTAVSGGRLVLQRAGNFKNQEERAFVEVNKAVDERENIIGIYIGNEMPL